KNRVVAFALDGDGARLESAIGELGGGPGRFAGPMAVTAGRNEHGNTPDVYVADAHSRRIARLRLEAGSLRWGAEVHHDADLVTSLDADRWGNLYASAPRQGIRKFNSDLVPVAELRAGLASPRGFHVPFFNVRDHRDGSVARVGQPNALSVESWSDG